MYAEGLINSYPLNTAQYKCSCFEQNSQSTSAFDLIIYAQLCIDQLICRKPNAVVTSVYFA